MKVYVDNEYVGFGKLYYNVPLDIGIEHINTLTKQGYKQVCFPHITAVGKSHSQLQMSPGINLLACCRVMMQHYITSWKDLPILLFVKDSLDGGLTLRPFRLVQGKNIKTNIKDNNNNLICLDLITEKPITIL